MAWLSFPVNAGDWHGFRYVCQGRGSAPCPLVISTGLGKMGCFWLYFFLLSGTRVGWIRIRKQLTRGSTP